MNSAFVTEKTVIKRSGLSLGIDIPLKQFTRLKYMTQICVYTEIMIKLPTDGVIYLTRKSGMSLLETPSMTLNELIFLTG